MLACMCTAWALSSMELVACAQCWPFGYLMVVCCNAQDGCREAVLAYLWALVGVNEGRTAGGEKGVLKEQAVSQGMLPIH